jgi:TRAP-type mannitol/chloroaromatic compound transport system permease small subunit
LQVIDAFSNWLGRTVAWFYLAAVLVTFWEVVARYVFNMPTTWAFEVTTFLCASGYLLSGPSVTARERHIAITSLMEIAGPRTRWFMHLVAHLVGIFAICGLTYAAWNSGIHAFQIWERTGTAFNSPAPAIIKPMIAVAGALVLIQLIALLVRHVAAFPRR